MNGVMAVVKTGDPIEAAIAEAIDLYKKRYGVKPAAVVIHTSNPASVEAPEGVRLVRSERVRSTIEALAGVEDGC